MNTYCCVVMKQFIANGEKAPGCIPGLYNKTIIGCDGLFDKDEGGGPIRFCPWCGKELT